MADSDPFNRRPVIDSPHPTWRGEYWDLEYAYKSATRLFWGLREVADLLENRSRAPKHTLTSLDIDAIPEEQRGIDDATARAIALVRIEQDLPRLCTNTLVAVGLVMYDVAGLAGACKVGSYSGSSAHQIAWKIASEAPVRAQMSTQAAFVLRLATELDLDYLVALIEAEYAIATNRRDDLNTRSISTRPAATSRTQEGASAPSPIPVETIQPDVAGPSTFYRSGAGWLVSFRGLTVTLPNWNGTAYLHQLIRQGGRPVAVEELEAIHCPPSDDEGNAQVDDYAPDERSSAPGDANPLADKAALRQYRERLLDLPEEIEAANRAEDEAEVHRLTAEQEGLRRELETTTGLRGASRRFTDQQRLATDRVRKAIGAILSVITKAHPALGEHLSASLKHRGSSAPCYDPPHAVPWILD